MEVSFCGPAGTEPAERAGVRLVVASDTHSLNNWQQRVPDGDVFVHCGDFTRTGKFREIEKFARFVRSLPHGHKIVVAGNHEITLDNDSYERTGARWHEHYRYDTDECLRALDGITYLQDEETVVEGVRFWGSPWTPQIDVWAFGAEPGEPMQAKFQSIPERIDVLITHGPPFGVRDEIMRGFSLGCRDLKAAVDRVRPSLHVFGHIHAAHGHERRDDTVFVNAAVCDEKYRDVNPLYVVDLIPRR